MTKNLNTLDYAFRGGKVITVNDRDEIAESVGVRGDRIVFVGSDREIAPLVGADTKTIALNGRALLPGFIDTHYHAILSGLLSPGKDAAMIDIFYKNQKSLADIFGLLTEVAGEKPPGTWISMFGYEPSLLPENRHPTLAELDALAPDHPVHFMHGGGHICMYNSRALAYLGVFGPEDAAKYPPGEVVVEGGKLTGMVRGHTHFWLWGQVDYAKKAQEEAALKALQHCLRHGITSIHDCGALGADSFHIMQNLCRSGRFPVRVCMLLHSIFGKTHSKEINEHWLNLGFLTGLGDAHFRVGACKFMIDGGSGAPSCATRTPYSHDPDLKGETGWGREETAEYIRLIHGADCQATAHAIGDLAVEYMVEGYEKAYADKPGPDLRHRIEHCTLTDPDLIRRMARLNLCPSVNVSCVEKLGVKLAEYYGKERNRYLCPIRSMLDAGVVCSLHSDTPSYEAGVALLDAAVNRFDRMNQFQCDRTQAVTVLEAVRCATLHGAWASFEEDQKGSLEPGKLADAIVLSEDILGIDPVGINQVKVDLTMIGGKIHYEREEASKSEQ